MKSAQIYKPEFTKITDGHAGAEGPVFNSSGSRLYMVAPEVEKDTKPAGQVLSVDTVLNKAEVLCSPSFSGFGGIPAGCQTDKSGDLWVADMRLGLLHINPSNGACQQICKRDYGFQAMQGCNDCVFDCYGNLWITAPAGSIAPAPYRRSMEEPFGSIYCYTTEGIMKRIDTGYKFPNGIAVQYDKTGSTPENLIVAETPTKTLWSFPFIKDSPGSVDVSKKSVFGHLRGRHEGGPDGMDFDSQGNLLVANWGAGYIDVFNRFGGCPQTRIELPFKRVSNVHFKPGTRDVYVTEHDTHGLWRFEWLHVGAPQFCEMEGEVQVKKPPTTPDILNVKPAFSVPASSDKSNGEATKKKSGETTF